jgi:mitogen-activated protein kinase 1/3
LNEEFELPNEYVLTGVVGSAVSESAPGTTVVAHHFSEDKSKSVAFKKVEQAFDSHHLAALTYRDLKIMRLLDHDNLLKIKFICEIETFKDLEHFYVCMDHMPHDLSKIIGSKAIVLNEQHIQFIVYQILRGLKYLHSAGVTHRDIRPRNILVDDNFFVKIRNFGHARLKDPYLTEVDLFRATDTLNNKWHRAPEIIFCRTMQYETVDIWSVGCILAELYLRKPLF